MHSKRKQLSWSLFCTSCCCSSTVCIRDLDTFNCCSSTVCIRYLDKLNMIWQFDFRLEPVFATAHFKSDQKLNIINLLFFTMVRSKSLMHTVNYFCLSACLFVTQTFFEFGALEPSLSSWTSFLCFCQFKLLALLASSQSTAQSSCSHYYNPHPPSSFNSFFFFHYFDSHFNFLHNFSSSTVSPSFSHFSPKNSFFSVSLFSHSSHLICLYFLFPIHGRQCKLCQRCGF